MIISFGGYLSTPVVFAGYLLGIPSISHEQAIVPGLATRINAKFSKKVFLTYQDSKKYFSASNAEVIGNLTREDTFKKEVKSPNIKAFLKQSKRAIFVTGGNQGSHFINRLIFESINALDNYHILHQLGTANFKNDHEKAKEIKHNNYLALDYIDPSEIGPILNCADITISRSGANTVWELGILGKVSILIPLAHSANNEQAQNAKVLEEIGSTIVLNQEDLTNEILRANIEKVFKNHQTFLKSATLGKSKFPRNAAEKMAEFVLRYT